MGYIFYYHFNFIQNIIHCIFVCKSACIFLYINYTGDNFWIGLEDTVKEGDFRWVDDLTSPSFTGWGSGQPSNFRGVEDCTHFSSSYNYNWNDRPCNDEIGSICEKQAKL